MDDLKLFTKDDHELDGLLQTIKKFSDNIGMKFGIEKCAKATFLKRRLEKSIELDNSTKIKELEQEEVYKYLGVNESNGIQHVTMKEKIRKECYRRVRAILKTQQIESKQLIHLPYL